jgi:hypothetical protein
VVGAVEKVRVDLQRDARVRVAELTADVDDVQALRDQERGEAVPERMEGELPGRLQPRAPDGLAEAFADVAIFEAAAERVRKDEVARLLVAAGEPVLTQAPGEGGGENDLASASFGLERGVFAVAGELAVDADQSGLVVDVGPGEAERFADPEAGVGEELEQWPVTSAGVFE